MRILSNTQISSNNQYMNNLMADYTIIIDGEWSCGKTLFHKKK